MKKSHIGMDSVEPVTEQTESTVKERQTGRREVFLKALKWQLFRSYRHLKYTRPKYETFPKYQNFISFL